MCQMPECLLPDRIIEHALAPDYRGHMPDGCGMVDHIAPLREEDTPGHVWSNVRAAHALCTPDEGRNNIWEFKRACHDELMSLLRSDEAVGARGAAHEPMSLKGTLQLGSWPNYLILTPARLLWCYLSRPEWSASLALAMVRAYADGTQLHRYAVRLEHGPIERTRPVPELGPTRIETMMWEETALVFSRKDTKLAVALRRQLATFGVPQGPPLALDPVPRTSNNSRGILRSTWT